MVTHQNILDTPVSAEAAAIIMEMKEDTKSPHEKTILGALEVVLASRGATYRNLADKRSQIFAELKEQLTPHNYGELSNEIRATDRLIVEAIRSAAEKDVIAIQIADAMRQATSKGVPPRP